MLEEVIVDRHKVIVNKRLAEGGFGFVDLVHDSVSRREYVLKRCSVQRQEDYDVVNKEITMLNKFKGSNMIVEIMASTIINSNNNNTNKDALLLLEYCSNGHLLDKVLMRGTQFFNIHEIYTIFIQILNAVKLLHSTKPYYIVHRDLKLENILFKSDNTIRLCDFGSCVEGPVSIATSIERNKESEIVLKTTTPMYRAPEMVDLYQREILTEKTDIWALGCILYTLCFLKHPFQEAGSLGILNSKIIIEETNNYNQLGSQGAKLLMRMLDLDCEARPTIEELMQGIEALTKEDVSLFPALELSVEAKRRKQERIDRDQRRTNNKKKTKVPPAVQPRSKAAAAAVGVIENSVAARRLAARGIPVTTSSSSITSGHSNNNSNNNNNNLDLDLFANANPEDLFTRATAGSSNANNTNTDGGTIGVDGFDDGFGTFDAFASDLDLSNKHGDPSLICTNDDDGNGDGINVGQTQDTTNTDLNISSYNFDAAFGDNDQNTSNTFDANADAGLEPAFDFKGVTAVDTGVFDSAVTGEDISGVFSAFNSPIPEINATTDNTDNTINNKIDNDDDDDNTAAASAAVSNGAIISSTLNADDSLLDFSAFEGGEVSEQPPQLEQVEELLDTTFTDNDDSSKYNNSSSNNSSSSSSSGSSGSIGISTEAALLDMVSETTATLDGRTRPRLRPPSMSLGATLGLGGVLDLSYDNENGNENSKGNRNGIESTGIEASLNNLNLNQSHPQSPFGKVDVLQPRSHNMSLGMGAETGMDMGVGRGMGMGMQSDNVFRSPAPIPLTGSSSSNSSSIVLPSPGTVASKPLPRQPPAKKKPSLRGYDPFGDLNAF